eukprot:scaffold52125_cov35-Phaeocystis_antarctica.AAC.1
MGPSDLFDVTQRADAAAEALRRTPHRARTAAASLLGMREPRHRPCCSCGGHRLANIVFQVET